MTIHPSSCKHEFVIPSFIAGAGLCAGCNTRVPIPMVREWKGVRLKDCTKEQLIECIEYLATNPDWYKR